jgi:hypothetical protein
MQYIDRNKAYKMGQALGIDWRKVDLIQFQKGMNVEQEHWDTVDGNWIMVAKIALDHLAELPDYYDRLEVIEEI